MSINRVNGNHGGIVGGTVNGSPNLGVVRGLSQVTGGSYRDNACGDELLHGLAERVGFVGFHRGMAQ